MPYSRQRPQVAPNGRITVRLTPEQRDLFLQSPETPPALGHALHRSPVRQGKLTLRVTRNELDALIRVAANTRVPDRREERRLSTFLRYLETIEDRFAEPDVGEADVAEESGESPGEDLSRKNPIEKHG